MANEMQDSVFHRVYIPWEVQVSSQQNKWAIDHSLILIKCPTVTKKHFSSLKQKQMFTNGFSVCNVI